MLISTCTAFLQLLPYPSHLVQSPTGAKKRRKKKGKPSHNSFIFKYQKTHIDLPSDFTYIGLFNINLSEICFLEVNYDSLLPSPSQPVCPQQLFMNPKELLAEPQYSTHSWFSLPGPFSPDF